jgi:DNA-binding transcriptional ArsR family regulator
MLKQDKPLRATQIAEQIGKEFRSVQMHIIGLTRMGYAESPEKGQYIITEKGKKALGVGEINPENAKTILACLPQDKSFHFYASIGKPLSLRAYGLQDFGDKILKVDVKSIEFHMNRGDFEAWFASLGDAELAKEAALLKEKNMAGEELRKGLHDIVENRFKVLTRAVEHTPSPQ